MVDPIPGQARPTMYAGTQMRSRLEADFAGWLDRQGLKWEYEPTCFAGPDGQWLPDFRLSGYDIYIELKPVAFGGEGFDEEPRNDRMRRAVDKMKIAFLTEPTATVALIFWEYGSEWPVTGLIYSRRTGEELAYKATLSTFMLLGSFAGLGVALDAETERRSARSKERVESMIRSREGWGRSRALMALIEESGDLALIERARAVLAEKATEAEESRARVADL
ncbi:hypothetical protein [Frankia sp. R82]|uniref:hypothetical protein n=1 Tax=Frankia sp. R82 TaxID=2950553 RepID=UPI002043EE8E|nr:hypothetical protein [Frankia sp. R82]MCM3882244.1 hypothetical protein [Frankia sp. R82]